MIYWALPCGRNSGRKQKHNKKAQIDKLDIAYAQISVVRAPVPCSTRHLSILLGKARKGSLRPAFPYYMLLLPKIMDFVDIFGPTPAAVQAEAFSGPALARARAVQKIRPSGLIFWRSWLCSC